MNKTKKTVIVIAAVIIAIFTVVLVYKGIQQWRIANRVPILKIMSKGPDLAMFDGTEFYYILYDNGDLVKTEKFSVSETETYDLYQYEEDKSDNTVADSEIVTQYAKEIIKITENMGTSYLTGKLFVLDSKYYFSAYDGGKHIDSLYEYFPQDGSVKKLVSTKRNEEIQYIEAY